LKTIRDLGKKLGLSPREIDKAIFMYDRLNKKGNLYKK